MATKVDICNMALSILGDEATVTSIDPPEGSPQADHCARFYPLAVKEILSAHPWGFATKRLKLSELAMTPVGEESKHAYAIPSDCVRLVGVEVERLQGMLLLPQYTLETHEGNLVLVTPEKEVWIKYVSDSVEEALFPPTFTSALVRLLASMLAGPLVPGSSGVSMTEDQLKLYEYFLERALLADDRQQRVKETYRSNLMGDCTLENEHVFY